MLGDERSSAHARLLRQVLALHRLHVRIDCALTTVPQVALLVQVSERRATQLLAEAQLLQRCRRAWTRWLLADPDTDPVRFELRSADTDPDSPNHDPLAALLDGDTRRTLDLDDPYLWAGLTSRLDR